MWQSSVSREILAKGAVETLRGCCGRLRWSSLTGQTRGLSTEIFVSRLSSYATEEEFSATFSRFGNVEEVRLIRDKITQRPKGYGFVRYKSEVEAQRAVKAMDGRTTVTFTRSSWGNSISQSIVDSLSNSEYIQFSGDQVCIPFFHRFKYTKTSKSYKYYDDAWCTIIPNGSGISLGRVWMDERRVVIDHQAKFCLIHPEGYNKPFRDDRPVRRLDMLKYPDFAQGGRQRELLRMDLNLKSSPKGQCKSRESMVSPKGSVPKE
ncbi:hypothetical protein Taro_017167, partial [Colocasia esculenta]|nr:hypothetical protein [Colocasia esculenta]